MMFELVIFDCDGVLIDSEWIASTVEVGELAQLGCDISVEDYLDIALGRTDPEVQERLFELYGVSLPEGHWESVQQRLKDAFERDLRPILGVKEALQNLSVPVCVGSSSGAKRLHHTLTVTGLWSYFNGKVFGAECVTQGKPAPDIFLHAAEQMNTDPSRCLVIEDSIYGVGAARAAGMEVWGFYGGRHFQAPHRVETLARSGVEEFFCDMKDLLSLMDSSRHQQ